MSAGRLDARGRLQLLLAMAGDGCTAALRDRQDAVARHLGMSGAEADLARARRSVDARVNLAVALACAVRHAGDVETADARCAAAGFDEESRAAIAAIGQMSAAEACALIDTIRS